MQKKPAYKGGYSNPRVADEEPSRGSRGENETTSQIKNHIVKTLVGINGNMKEFCNDLEERFKKAAGNTQKKIGKASAQLVPYAGEAAASSAHRGSVVGGKNVLEKIESQAKMFLTDYSANDPASRLRALPYKKNYCL